MNLIQRLKKDKKFRVKVFIFWVVGMLLIGSTGEKKEAVFDQNSACDGQLFSNCLTTVHDGELCVIEYNNFWLPNNCVNCVRNGFYATSASKCCSGYVVSGEQRTCDRGQPCYLCRAATSEELENQCNSAESAIGAILQGMIPSLDCKSAYYLTIFGGGFLLLIVVAMI